MPNVGRCAGVAGWLSDVDPMTRVLPRIVVPDDAIFRELRESFDRLRGRTFQVIEAAGLPERQETALKGVIRQQTYTSQAQIESQLRRQQ
jgi:hypothetical protein